MTRETTFSDCRQYRYTIWRSWPSLTDPYKGYVQFIGLNPSTADETNDDPTIRRCRGFAASWGFTEMCMTNLFSFRATDPRDMNKAADPIGPLNDDWLIKIADQAAIVVAAWGCGGEHLSRDKEVRRLFAAFEKKMHCLKLTKDGHPQHPLYLAKTLTPIVMP